MVPSEEPNASLDPGSFDGRLLVEILSWDWNLHVGMSREDFPAEYRFQGGLTYGRWFEIEGRIAAPSCDSNRRIRVWLSPFGPEEQFDVNSSEGVGRLYRHEPPQYGWHMSVQLQVPETAIVPVASCLSSTWKYIHLWTFSDDGNEASVHSYCFSRDVPENLEAWVSAA